jgi:hypothetical protein
MRRQTTQMRGLYRGGLKHATRLITLHATRLITLHAPPTALIPIAERRSDRHRRISLI